MKQVKELMRGRRASPLGGRRGERGEISGMDNKEENEENLK